MADEEAEIEPKKKKKHRRVNRGAKKYDQG